MSVIAKNVKVTKESKSGRNLEFSNGRNKMNRKEFVDRINNGYYPDYHLRTINGVKTPVSNPDKNSGNNLG